MLVNLIAGLCLCGGVSGPYQTADRITVAPPQPVGIYNLPFAPEGLSDCDEMLFYTRQFGLPDSFSLKIGWRESNCRNEEGVHTSCCYGYFQIHEMHFRHHPDIYGSNCSAFSYHDIDGDTPIDKQRSACSAKQLWDAAGVGPWT